jgi:hypothetical protein
MTTFIGVKEGRLEEILRLIEGLDEQETLSQFIERNAITFPEFVSIVSELRASRIMTSKGGARITYHGTSDAAGIAGFYKRFNWKFRAEVGSDSKHMDDRTIKEAFERTVQFVLQKITGDFEQCANELRAREIERAKGREATGNPPGNAVN